MRRAAVLTWLLPLSVVIPAVASEPLVTDRPDFTESAVVVPSGRLQLELGATWARDNDDVETTSLGEALVRWGVAQRLEVRLGLPSWQRSSHGPVWGQGFADMEAGVKVQLHTAEGRSAAVGADWALILVTSAPTGGDEVSAGVWQPSAVLAAGWELGGDWSLGANLGFSRPADEGRRFTSAWFSTTVGIGISDTTAAFLELVGVQRERFGGPGTLAVQAGLTRRLGADLQFDVRIARRLTAEGPDLLAGVGAAVRL